MRSSKERNSDNMKKQTMGMMIAALRKEQGMTQLELAEKMGVTDKAVSKWERDLSCPDISTLPKLAEIFGISVDDLMQVKPGADEKKDVPELVHTILTGVALAMGVAVMVLSFLHQVDPLSAIGMLGLGLSCLAITQFSKKD